MASLTRRLIETVVDLRRLRGLLALPQFIAEYERLRRAGAPLRILDLYPQLGDRVASTPFDPHYLHQAAWLARRLAELRPSRHVDIGSDVRLIATVSAFVPIDFVDFRPLAVTLPGLSCRAGDITALTDLDGSIASLSCLHVIEHIGLGRYGDPLDPDGPSKAAGELSRVVAPGGRLFLSTPIGRKRIEFNAHHVFDPIEIMSSFAPLSLDRFSFVDDAGALRSDATPDEARNARYACGLFEFIAPQAASSPSTTPPSA